MVRTRVEATFSSLRSRIRSRRDRRRLEERYPFFRGYDDEAVDIEGRLRPVYEDYTARISTRDFAISLELSVFAAFLMTHTQPERVMDMGSGFSSYVVRSMKPDHEDVEVVSVDDDPQWMRRTREFLQGVGVDAAQTMLIEQLDVGKMRGTVDLLLYDFGRMDVRSQYLEKALSIRSPRGFAIIDDVHKPFYERQLAEAVSRLECTMYDIGSYTRDGFHRRAGLIAPSAR